VEWEKWAGEKVVLEQGNGGIYQLYNGDKETLLESLVSWHAVQVENVSSILCEVPDHKRIDAHL